MKKQRLIVITGPTASGKSALAVSLAHLLDTEIISADSRQIYKGIPIVTAVPSYEEREGIKHHLLETLTLDTYYSAAKFQEDSEDILKGIFQERDIAIICGGSMLYLDALTKGIDDLPTIPSEIRESLMNEWGKRGDQWLLDALYAKDPDYFRQIDHRNLKRVLHALEVSITAQKPYSSLLTQKSKKVSERNLPFEVTKFCLTGNRDLLFNRINLRVLDMIDKGLEEEARSVYDLRHLNSLNTVGLKEMFQYFEGNMKFDEAVARIQKNTRVYAKKQLTWHKRDESLIYLDFNEPNSHNVKKILDKISFV